MTKIKAKATQDFTWNGVEIRKDSPLSLSAGEFNELEPVGLVKRAKTKTPAKAPVPAPAPTKAPEPQAADAAD